MDPEVVSKLLGRRSRFAKLETDNRRLLAVLAFLNQ
jgi:hypothetical protein